MVKTTQTKKQNKNESKKAENAVVAKKEVSKKESYKQDMILASQEYINRRLAVESLASKAKQREIKGLDLSGAINASFEVLKQAGMQPQDFENLRLTAYSKALARSVIVLNAIASGNFTTKYNCLAGAFVDLKRACKKAGLYTKKELSFSAYSGGKTGGANPAACMLGVILDIFKLGTWDSNIKAVKIKPFAVELLSKITIESPLFYNKD